MIRILFQGDSITDAGRDRGNAGDLGRGYPLLVESTMGFEAPGEYQFLNRGIGGDRVTDLYARIKVDIINLKPDVMSILVGVNDVWHELKNGRDGVDEVKYFKIYSMLIEEIKAALPEVKIMILEPFVLKASATEEEWDTFRDEVHKRAKKAREIAEKYDLVFIALQDKFDEAAQKCPANYWLRDGVHPTPKGHELIKREWIKAYETMKIG